MRINELVSKATAENTDVFAIDTQDGTKKITREALLGNIDTNLTKVSNNTKSLFFTTGKETGTDGKYEFTVSHMPNGAVFMISDGVALYSGIYKGNNVVTVKKMDGTSITASVVSTANDTVVFTVSSMEWYVIPILVSRIVNS